MLVSGVVVVMSLVCVVANVGVVGGVDNDAVVGIVFDVVMLLVML